VTTHYNVTFEFLMILICKQWTREYLVSCAGRHLTRLPFGFKQGQISQIWHFLIALGIEIFGLAFWHFLALLGEFGLEN